MDFILGVLSSLAATLIVYVGARTRFHWPLPRGVAFLPASRDSYTKWIEKDIREGNKYFMLKCLTGFDLLASDRIKAALEQANVEKWDVLRLVLTRRRSAAFDTEIVSHYSRQKLESLQDVSISYFRNLARLRLDSEESIKYLDEQKSFLNILFLSSKTYFFIRGFTPVAGPSGQLIFRVDHHRCSPRVKELVMALREHYELQASAA